MTIEIYYLLTEGDLVEGKKRLEIFILDKEYNNEK